MISAKREKMYSYSILKEQLIVKKKLAALEKKAVLYKVEMPTEKAISTGNSMYTWGQERKTK